MRSSIRTLGVFQQPPGSPAGAALLALGVAGLAGVLGGASACSGSSRPGPGGPTVLSVVGDPPTVAGSPPTGSAPAAPSPGGAATTPATTVPPTTDQPTTTRPTTRRTTVPPPATGGPPRVVSFTVRQAPTCLGPGRPGRDLVLAWAVAGAPGAELSEDTPGMPGSYNPGLPATGSMAIGFACDGDGGSAELHVFDLYAAEGDMNQAPYAELDVAAAIPGVVSASPLGGGD